MPTWDVRVDELLTAPGGRLHYQYDYGDNWWLILEVEEIVAGRVPPGRATLLESGGVGPPEDCGGVHGYRMIVAASDPTHPDHRQALADMADLWGDEVAPHDLGLVPFGPASIGEQLQALDLGRRPVLQLRETAQQLELLRKYEGQLVPTTRGRELAGDPIGLWSHLVAALPMGGRDVADAEWQAGVLLLALMASGSTHNAEVTIAKLLTALGWAVGDGHPIDRRAVTGLIAEDVHLLRQLGAFDTTAGHLPCPGRTRSLATGSLLGVSDPQRWWAPGACATARAPRSAGSGMSAR